MLIVMELQDKKSELEKDIEELIKEFIIKLSNDTISEKEKKSLRRNINVLIELIKFKKNESKVITMKNELLKILEQMENMKQNQVK